MNRKWDPFYLHLDIFDPHEPWDPPQWYVDRYDPGYEGREIIFPLYAAADYLTPAELNHCRALYAGEVSLVDTWLGRFMVTLENMGLLDNTAIILASDHGFYLGEHNWMGKTSIQKGLHRFVPLYEEVAHVPQIVYLPGAKPGRSNALVQPVDIAPTVLRGDLTAPGMPAQPTPGSMQGSSWMPLLAGRGQLRPGLRMVRPPSAQPGQIPSQHDYHERGMEHDPQRHGRAAGWRSAALRRRRQSA